MAGRLDDWADEAGDRLAEWPAGFKTEWTAG